MPAPGIIFKASRAATCPKCSRPMAVGADIAATASGAYVHAHCLPAAARAVAAASAADLDGFDGDDAPEAADPLAALVTAAAKAPAGKPAGGDDWAAGVESRLMDEARRIAADADRRAKAAARAALADAMGSELPTLLASVTASVKDTAAEIIRERVGEARAEFRAETQRAIARFLTEGVVRQEITIREPGKEDRKLEGEVYHPRFDWIIKLAKAGKPILLVGPAGCGKTHTGEQLARALGHFPDRFGIVSCSPAMTERHFLGRTIPNITTGEELYRCSKFVEIFENGGTFVLDELDNSDPSVLLCLNAALANGRLPVPDRLEKPVAIRHPDFVLVAAANTKGEGADRQYTGRARLDEASLDRFRVGRIQCDYVPAVERVLCPDDALYALLKGWRKAIKDHGLEAVLSTRFMKDAADMLAFGATHDDIRRAFFLGWRPDAILKVNGGPLPLD